MLNLLLTIAAVPLCWERVPNRPAPAQFDVFHGESLDFRCTFTGFGAPPFAGAADVRLWYQTNGMGAAWWSIPATASSNRLSAVLGPSADPGAERLTVFFGAPSNAYAAAQVRFRNSPGATPNHLDPPSVLDWQAELAAATNALWDSSAAAFMQKANAYTKAEADARIAELAPQGITTNDVCNIVTNEVHTFGEWVETWEPEDYGELMLYGGPWHDGPNEWNISYRPRKGMTFESWASADGTEFADKLVFNCEFGLTNFTLTLTRTHSVSNALGLARMKDIPTNHVTHAELEEALGAIPEVDTSNLATKAELTPIQSSVNSMWATLYGENVWIAITNYMRQVANTVPSLRLWEVRDSQTNMVYSSAEEIEHVVTQKVNEAKLEIKGMIPRTAWGSYQSSGEENPSSNAVTVVNSSKIMLTGGGECGWRRYIRTRPRRVFSCTANGRSVVKTSCGTMRRLRSTAEST